MKKSISSILILAFLVILTPTANAINSDCEIRDLVNKNDHSNGFPRPLNSIFGQKVIKIFSLPVSLNDLHISETDYNNSIQDMALTKQFIEQNSYGKVKINYEIAEFERIPKVEFSTADFEFNQNRFGPEANTGKSNIAVEKALSNYMGAFNLRNFDVVIISTPTFAQPGIGYSYSGMQIPSKDGQVDRIVFKFGSLAQNSLLTIHELNHSLFGLVDLYNHKAANEFRDAYVATAGWGIMSSIRNRGAHYFAWEKYLNGWIDDSQLACFTNNHSRNISLTPLYENSSGLKAVILKLSENKIIVIEYRISGKGFDDFIKSGSLIYLVDGSVLEGEDPVTVLLNSRYQTLQTGQELKFGKYRIKQLNMTKKKLKLRISKA